MYCLVSLAAPPSTLPVPLDPLIPAVLCTQEKAKDRERELARAQEDEEYARAAAAKRSAAAAAVSPGAGHPPKRARMTAAALMEGEEDIVMDYGSDKVSRE